MMAGFGQCAHVDVLHNLPSSEEILYIHRTRTRCTSCPAQGPNLWLCLQPKCLYVGCGDSAVDHSTQHAEDTKHCLQLNLTSMKMWCYTCTSQVFREVSGSGQFATVHRPTSTPCSAPSACRHKTQPSPAAVAQTDDSDSDSEANMKRPRGLTGLRNIGNTCYMNAAIQALSNCPPLTRFFLECPGFVTIDKAPALAKNYMKLITEIWHKKRSSYVTPTAVFNGIRAVHPMFRGYLQHDSQEFLRCFMDFLHEELKYQVVVAANHDQGCSDCRDVDGDRSSGDEQAAYVRRRVHVASEYDANELSDTDYETCDSGLSSESNSLSNEAGASNSNHQEMASFEGEEGPSVDLERCDDFVEEQPKHLPESFDETIKENIGDEADVEQSASCVMSEVLPCKPSTDAAGDNISDCKLDVKLESSETDELGAVAMDQSVGTPSTSTDSALSDSVSTLSMSSRLQYDNEAGQSLMQDHSCVSAIPSQFGRKSSSSPHLKDDCANRPGKVKRTASESMMCQPCQHKKLMHFSSIISAIFDGKILSSVQCLTCERISCTNETFQDLSLPIPGKEQLQFIRASTQQHAIAAASCDGPLLQSVSQRSPCAESSWRLPWLSSMVGWVYSWFWGPVITLQDCLAAFFSADDLKGDNMYSCEKCKKLRNGIKYSKVLQLPEILCIHLKRFRHEFMFSSKIGSYVSFPLENLDMRPYLHKDCKDKVTLYDLVAVICHHGTAGGGHYTTYALNYVNLCWYEYDDQTVTEVDPQQVESCEAYVLFYRKKNDDMEMLRLKAAELSRSSESSLMTFFISRQWISKFNTFAEPGPINNHDFLCRHGDVAPAATTNDITDLIMEIPQSLWEFLHARFGGGPAVNRLSVCQTCLQEEDRLRRRQQHEKDSFLTLNAEFQDRCAPGAVYALSMAWYRDWENFVCGKTKDPPGQIDNTKISQLKNGIPVVLLHSDYAQVSEDMWLFLHDIYGGGPELVLKPASATTPLPSVAAVKADDGNDSLNRPEALVDK